MKCRIKKVISTASALALTVAAAGSGITSNDALVIQKFLLGSISSLPESYMQTVS